MTSDPKSANILPQNRPFSSVKSSTRQDERGPCFSFFIVCVALVKHPFYEELVKFCL